MFPLPRSEGSSVFPEAATRLFFGPIVTYALLDGLFKPGEKPYPPAPEKVEHIVDMYMKAIA